MKLKIDKSKKFLKKLPKTPGVYLFYNKKNQLIYIGRAANLKTRVSSYFNTKSNYGGATSVKRPIEMLINEVTSANWIKTDNLLEAAVLEANLIKKHMPIYNVREKDNKSFAYLFFDMASDFPKPIIIRGRDLGRFKTEKGQILGPYQSYRTLKNILLVARKIYPYSTCLSAGSHDKSNRGKPCFHNQIGLCPGACTGEIASKDYKKGIRKLIRFLKSTSTTLSTSRHPETKKKQINDIALMPDTGLYHSHIRAHTSVHLSRIEGYDISHFQKETAYGSMVVFENGKAKNGEYRLFKIREAKKGDDIAAFKEILERRFRHTEWKYPGLIVVDGGNSQVNAAVDVLKKAFLKIPVLGISKAGKHAESAASLDKLIFQTSIKKPLREILTSQKILLQKVRNEAHRFAIRSLRKSQNLKK